MQATTLQGGSGGEDSRRKPVGTAKSAKSGTGKGELEAKKRVGSQLQRPRAQNQALARGSWRPRSASEASWNGQERQIRHWQGGIGGQEARRKPVGRAKSAKSGTGKGELEAKKRVGSQSEGPIAPNQALARGSLTPRCALEASRNAKSGTDNGEFERKARKGSPRESRGGARPWSWRYGKTTLLQEYELPVQTGARSDDLAETHPTEGMTKVIPALSCKHDNEERRSGSDGSLARRQLLRQRGGFIRASPIPPGHLDDPRLAIHEWRSTILRVGRLIDFQISKSSV